MVSKPDVAKPGPVMVLKYVPRCEWVSEFPEVNPGFWLSHSPISWLLSVCTPGVGNLQANKTEIRKVRGACIFQVTNQWPDSDLVA